MFLKPSTTLLFFQKEAFSDKVIEEVLDKETTDFSRIRCPHCKWQPRASSRWYCGNIGQPEYFFDACGIGWNTFETRGKCPGCQHQWRWTSCLSCGEWSLHSDWYFNGKSSN